MDIRQSSCALSPLIDHNELLISTPRNRFPPTFSFTSNTLLNFSPITNVPTSDTSYKQFCLEHDTSHQSLIKTEDSFLTTYSTLQTMLSGIQLKLSSVFLYETEYLTQREQLLEQGEQSLTKHIQQLNNIRNEREQMEKEFLKIKNQLETAVIQITKFQTDGAQILHKLFSKSHQIDEQLLAIICESTASLGRCRTMIHSKINHCSQKLGSIQSELTDREALLHTTQLMITSMFELVNKLNHLNIENSQDITITTIDFEKRYQIFTNVLETTHNHWDINQQIDEVCLLEKEKIQLEEELLEQTIVLKNIYTILGRGIIS